jgi:hypothetical protein
VEYVQPTPVPPPVRAPRKKLEKPPAPPKYQPPAKKELKRRQYIAKKRSELARDIVAGRFSDNPRELRWALAKIKNLERGVA